MPRGTELSEFGRGEIIGLKKANSSYREIANILTEKINKLIDSMPRRVDAVLISRGNPTRY